jgi:uncharacterized membrane protein YphA (DoxX/SURF4 family)
MQRIRLGTWILSIGLAVVFGWFGIDKFLNPVAWLGWIPAWMDGLLGMPSTTWLNIIAVSEMTFAVMLLVPVRNVRRAGAVLIAVQLLGILPIAGFNDVGLRDFAMMMSAIALAVLL